MVSRFKPVFVGLLILTPPLIVAAKWHRRNALQIAVGGVLGLVVIRRLTMYLEGRLEGAAKNQAAAQAIISQVLHLFCNLTLLLGILGLALVALLLITGSSGGPATTRPPHGSGRTRAHCRSPASRSRSCCSGWSASAHSHY